METVDGDQRLPECNAKVLDWILLRSPLVRKRSGSTRSSLGATVTASKAFRVKRCPLADKLHHDFSVHNSRCGYDGVSTIPTESENNL